MSVRPPHPDGLLDLAVSAAAEAGALLAARFGRTVRGLTTKSTATDPVSDADRDAEDAIRATIASRRPDDGIIGEEHGTREGASGIRWLVDPLDGTVNFLFGIPHWSVSIAACDASGGVVGVIHDPMRGETFSAERGRGAWLNGERITVTGCSQPDVALVATGFSYDAAVRAEQAAIVTRVLPAVRDIRRLGSAALDLAWVACGRYDAYYEAPLGAWDRAAGLVLVEEAGGRWSELPPPRRTTGVLAATPGIHDALRALVDPDAA